MFNRKPIDFISYIHHRVMDFNESWDVLIKGPKGDGKSTVAISLAMRLDPRFDVDRNVSFDIEDWVKKTQELPPGSASVEDDAGTQRGGSSHKWQSSENQDFADLVQLGRTDRVINIFTTLDEMRLINRVRDTFKLIIVPERKLSNEETGGNGLAVQCILRVVTPDTFDSNGGRPFLTYPRYSSHGKIMRYRFYHPPEDVYKRYSLLRNEFKHNLREDMERRRANKQHAIDRIIQKQANKGMAGDTDKTNREIYAGIAGQKVRGRKIA